MPKTPLPRRRSFGRTFALAFVHQPPDRTHHGRAWICQHTTVSILAQQQGGPVFIAGDLTSRLVTHSAQRLVKGIGRNIAARHVNQLRAGASTQEPDLAEPAVFGPRKMRRNL